MAIDRPYTAQTWATGDVITKDKLKNIEDAIAAIDSEVTGARGYGASSGTLGKRIDDLVMIQDEQPTSANNEIWVRSTGDGVQVPTYEEFQNLENSVGEDYSSNKTYEVGNYVIYEDKLYRCTTPITTPEAWNASHWTVAPVGDELVAMKATTAAAQTSADNAQADVDDLKSALDSVVSFPFYQNLIGYEYEQGYLAANGVFVATSGSDQQKTTVAIPLDPGEYTVNVDAYSDSTHVVYVRAIAVYDANDNCTNYQQVAQLKKFTVSPTDSYVRINTKYSSVSLYNVKADTQISIKNDVSIPTDKTLKIFGMPADAKVTGEKIDSLSIASKTFSLDLRNYENVRGYLTTGGVFVEATQTFFHTTVPIALSAGDYAVSFEGIYNNSTIRHIRAIAVYNSIGTCTYFHQLGSTETDCWFSIKDGDTVRINATYDTVNLYVLAKREKIWSNYSAARRPIITCIFDGEYNNNGNYKAIFDKYNLRCGFAPGQRTNFPYTPISTYKEWENNGYEILAHSSVGVGTNTDATDDEIAAIVRESYYRFMEYGFNVRGFVAYQGNAKPIAVETAKKYFEYAATAPNHAGSYETSHPELFESNIYFNTTSPYELWRYSMQNSTLEQMTAAVDRCISTNGLLMFYGHANASEVRNMTVENVDALLNYIIQSGVQLKTPVDAIRDYYSIRYEDVVTN